MYKTHNILYPLVFSTFKFSDGTAEDFCSNELDYNLAVFYNIC